MSFDKLRMNGTTGYALAYAELCKQVLVPAIEEGDCNE